MLLEGLLWVWTSVHQVLGTKALPGLGGIQNCRVLRSNVLTLTAAKIPGGASGEL